MIEENSKMESTRPPCPHSSITLPRNFQFHYQDVRPPRTPEPEMSVEDPQPPPPRRPSLKVQAKSQARTTSGGVMKVRRRTNTLSKRHDLHETFGFHPIPTIEAPELHSEASMDLPALPELLDQDYLSPGVVFTRMISPPKTPVSQMREVDSFQTAQHWSDMGQCNQSETSSRPTSSSGFSDSSISSAGSFGSFPSLAGSCTTPEDDFTYPFSFTSPESKYRLPPSSPLASQRQCGPKFKIKMRTTFTEEMDRHLWMTYMNYLQDPTVTPFKALPTTTPPNGVCHRVARMARKTWKGPRTPSSLSIGRPSSRFSSRCGTPDTIKPAKSGSSTPVPGPSKTYLRYPTEKQCRRRLRDLAKQKPSFSAHYQRLLTRRSPSPFPSSSPQSAPTQTLSSPFSADAPIFSTRDMNVSLTTSTADSMQFGNPLSQLTTDATPRPTRNDFPHARSSAHQKSQSLHIGLGIGIGNMLGSSFSRMSEMTDSSISQHNARTWHAPSGNPPRLGSPLQLHAPKPISRPFKRRALHNFEDQVRHRGDSFVDQVFGAPAQSSHRRVRSRGFSLGDMVDGARRLPLSTSGPQEFNPFANISDVMHANGPQRPTPESQLSEGQATIRLGSPFTAKPNNTFPRATASQAFEPAASFEQRFAGFPMTSDHMGRS